MKERKSKSPDSMLRFGNGKVMKNRFMMAPLTNQQSHDDGKLSLFELQWLSMRAEGQFGLVMTCASNVQVNGKAWPGQLGIFSDKQVSGHKKLTESVRELGSLAMIQLFHGGMRSPKDLIKGRPVCPSDNEEYDARGLSLNEVYKLRNDFVTAAVRAKKAGYDGVEIHAAFGYLLAEFLSSEINHRTDSYGGSLENRSRLLFEIVSHIREICGPGFLIGVRLSPKRNGMVLEEVKQIAQRLIDTNKIDFLDITLWDVFKEREDENITGKTLLDHFLELEYNDVKLTVSGKLKGSEEVHQVMDQGVDFVTIGKSAILHHDFPVKVIQDEGFRPIETPVSVGHLKNEGLGPKFIEMMKSWPDFVQD